MTRIGIISDLHCGHLTGLTHPDWHWTGVTETAWRQKVCAYQKWAWATYIEFIKELGPFNRLIVLGDCIDGKGRKSGSNEHLTTDRDEQVQIAVACIEACGCSKIAIIRGTPYHTGVDEDWENSVARKLKAEIGNHLFININGVGISAKHFVGGTQVPQGKATAVLRAQVSNDQWCREYKDHPKASIFLRGHLHRNIVVDEPANLSIIAPGLQGWTDFGSKKCSMPVHFGIMAIEIDKKGEWQWQRRTAQIGQFVQSIKW